METDEGPYTLDTKLQRFSLIYCCKNCCPYIKLLKKSLQWWTKVVMCMEHNCIFCSFVCSLGGPLNCKDLWQSCQKNDQWYFVCFNSLVCATTIHRRQFSTQTRSRYIEWHNLILKRCEHKCNNAFDTSVGVNIIDSLVWFYQQLVAYHTTCCIAFHCIAFNSALYKIYIMTCE